jgi:hypothetical protein
MKKVKLFEEFVNEAKFKVGDTWEWNTQDGTKMVKIINIKPNGDIIAREAGSSEDFIVRDANKYLKKRVNEASVNLNASHLSSAEYQKAKKLKGFDAADWKWNRDTELYDKVTESETIMHEYDFLGMQAQAANMTREEWIAHYGTPEIGSGIDESKKGIYTVYFEDRDGEIQDWDVPASSPEEAIKMVKDGKALGPYDQTLPRGARNFHAKFYK